MFPGAAFLVGGWASVEFVGNRVEGAFEGILLQDEALGSFLATDNVFVGVGTVIEAFGGTSAGGLWRRVLGRLSISSWRIGSIKAGSKTRTDSDSDPKEVALEPRIFCTFLRPESC